MSDEEQFRQAGAIPFRCQGERIEFCLVTSKKTKEWSIPKGTIKVGETVAETALKNARKEVGLHGRIVAPALGSYTYRKWETTLEVTVLLMRVLQCEDEWEEAGKRQRCWVSKDEAMRRLARRELKELLEVAWERLQKD